jgi:hypothetical protein
VATFAAAWAEGQQMTLEQAIAEALAGSVVIDGSSLDAVESSMEGRSSCTSRES